MYWDKERAAGEKYFHLDALNWWLKKRSAQTLRSKNEQDGDICDRQRQRGDIFPQGKGICTFVISWSFAKWREK